MYTLKNVLFWVHCSKMIIGVILRQATSKGFGYQQTIEWTEVLRLWQTCICCSGIICSDQNFELHVSTDRRLFLLSEREEILQKTFGKHENILHRNNDVFWNYEYSTNKMSGTARIYIDIYSVCRWNHSSESHLSIQLPHLSISSTNSLQHYVDKYTGYMNATN